ncbi:MAG: hypothetical protein ACREEW_06360, partial [Caulobacteraceae bacterium]
MPDPRSTAVSASAAANQAAELKQLGQNLLGFMAAATSLSADLSVIEEASKTGASVSVAGPAIEFGSARFAALVFQGSVPMSTAGDVRSARASGSRNENGAEAGSDASFAPRVRAAQAARAPQVMSVMPGLCPLLLAPQGLPGSVALGCPDLRPGQGGLSGQEARSLGEIASGIGELGKALNDTSGWLSDLNALAAGAGAVARAFDGKGKWLDDLGKFADVVGNISKAFDAAGSLFGHKGPGDLGNIGSAIGCCCAGGEPDALAEPNLFRGLNFTFANSPTNTNPALQPSGAPSPAPIPRPLASPTPRPAPVPLPRPYG